MNIEDIPSIPDRERRFEEIPAMWGTPGSVGSTPVTVLGVGDVDDDEGVRLRVRASDGDAYEVLADQLWAVDGQSPNATVLDDYRAFVAEGGLPFHEDEEDEE
jgi:hypothetical protein